VNYGLLPAFIFMKFKNPKIEKLYEYMSEKTREAYSDPYLIANDVLCKQDTRGRILETCLSGETPQKVTFLFAVKKTFFYFAKNLTAFLLYLITAFAHRLSRQTFQFPEKGELVILDTYFVARGILMQSRFKDVFFPGLADALVRRKKNYAYVPFLFGTMHPVEWFRVFRILKKNGDSVLTEFQLLRFADYLEAVRFIFLYPLSVQRFAKSLGTSYEDEVLRHGLWQALDSVTFGAYMRFLFGKRLSLLEIEKIKCLSWYENQISNKNFYRGLRSLPGKVDIVGAQLFIRPYTLLNIIFDEREASFGVLPDKVLVNGPGYCFESDHVQVDVGPALRYAHLFNTEIHPHDGEIILVLMPFWDHVVRYILKVIRDVEWPVPVEIKFHPSTDRKIYENSLPEGVFVTDKKLPELLSRARIVVGRDSGSQAEAAALGIPVIDVQDSDEFSHGCMPEMGKGILWDQAVGAEEVARLVSQFQEVLQSDPSRLKEEGTRLRSVCFAEPTDELIGQAFGLD
jgi:hypothetical protein